MKKLFFLLMIVLGIAGNSYSAILVLEGKYQDKNLFVQNGFADNGVGFCTYEVTINGRTSTDEVNSSAFEIDFTAFKLIPGSAVVVEIKHKDGCTPKVLNPEVLTPKPTFEVLSINIDKNGLLGWSTKNEMGSLPYVVEQFRWNKWIPVGEVKGSGSMDNNSYSFQTIPHSGENKFRVKQVGFNDISKMSTPVIFNSISGTPTFEQDNKKGTIEFSSETLYEVYDCYGSITKRGYGNKLDISNLIKGSYFLCYDNVMSDFKKK
jgi:hypothetical protein